VSRHELSIQYGEMGRAFHFRLPRRASHVAIATGVILLMAFGILSWQLWTVASIYPELLFQNRRKAHLQRELEDIQRSKVELSQKVTETDRLAGRLLGRFGLVETPHTRVDLPEGGHLLELLFPETSPESRLAADAWRLGEKAQRRTTEMRAAARIAEAQILHWERIPSVAPAWGDFSSGFGWRFHPVLGRHAMHDGQDIANRIGTPVVATASGKIVTAEYNSSYGNHVVIHHGSGMRTLYAHLSAYRCKVGDQVRRGQVIGLLGNTGRSTGPHVHYEVHKGATPVNPMNWILPVTLVP
jgi:murein DD-endopeptidase MepM/ murein hydrolase activator NlpD